MQGPRVVPASLIQHEDRVNAGLKLVSKVLQKDRHRIGIHPRQRQREGLVRAGPAGGEQIQALEALIDDPGRAPAFVPDPCRPAFLAAPDYTAEIKATVPLCLRYWILWPEVRYSERAVN